jgi:ABC-type sugar transport system ATPase subunit
MTKSDSVSGPVILAVKGLGRADSFQDIEFEIRAGEIVGIAGLMGAGRTALVDALFGLHPADSGDIFIRGERVCINNPREAIRYGIGLVSENRTRYGLVLEMSVQQNITLTNLHMCCQGPLIDIDQESRVAEDQMRSFGIKASSVNQEVNFLSGGNQQKVVLAKTLLTDPEIILLDEPTRGIDVGAKAEIYSLITSLAYQGKAILLVSSELPEILSLSDRLLVMREGVLTAELDPGKVSQKGVMKHAMPC